MDLIKPGDRRAGQHGLRDAPPVLGDQRRIVARSEPAVERREIARRYAAAATEKSVRDTITRRRGDEGSGEERTSVVKGKRGSVRVDSGGRRNIKKKTHTN